MVTTRTLSCLLTLLLCSLATGCGVVPLGPDTEPYSVARFYQNASFRDEANGRTPSIWPSITQGTHTVIESGEGRTPGRYTSAHASHRKFFFVLPAMLQQAHTYNVSQEDGTLWFSAFAGYSPRYLDRDQPARGTVHIRKATKHTIVADISVRATSVYDTHNVAEPERQRQLEEWVGTFEFERASIPRPREE